MFLIICFGILIWCLVQLEDDKQHKSERKQDYNTAERRHNELLDSNRNRSVSSKQRYTRTVAQDEQGRRVAQEILEDI